MTAAALVDSHAHIHDGAFDDDRPATIERAREAGVGTVVNVGCDIEDSRRAIESATRFGLFASVGIHPHEARNAPEDLEAAFAPLLADDRVVAIGETGLDYFYDNSPRDVQHAVLRKQLALARQRALPVIFHHRDAFEDFVAILRESFAPPMRGVIHCFTGDTEQARTYTEEFDLYLGIGGVVTFKNANALRDAVRTVGLERLVLETDCPYLAPIPYRGRRNEPAYVAQTAVVVAEVLGRSVHEVARVTTDNARELFRLSNAVQT